MQPSIGQISRGTVVHYSVCACVCACVCYILPNEEGTTHTTAQLMGTAVIQSGAAQYYYTMFLINRV